MFSPLTILTTLSSVPCLLVARHVYFPSSYTEVLAAFVLFTSVVEFLIIAMFIGGIPMAEHDSLSPGDSSCTTGAGVTTLGETNKTTNKIKWLHF